MRKRIILIVFLNICFTSPQDPDFGQNPLGNINTKGLFINDKLP